MADGFSGLEDWQETHGTPFTCGKGLQFHFFRNINNRMNIEEHIQADPAVMLGKPTIRGTRVTVELVLRKLAEGASEDDVIRAYPQICRESVRAAAANPCAPPWPPAQSDFCTAAGQNSGLTLQGRRHMMAP